LLLLRSIDIVLILVLDLRGHIISLL